jgi:molecular chaperone GrpE
VNRDADLPSSSEVGGEAQAPNGTSAGDESDEQLELPLDALLDWGNDPGTIDEELDKGLEAQSAEALVAAERDEYLDALRRLQADFDNFRKRSMRQQTELLERATEGLCMRLLPVLDALDLATEHLRDQADTNDAVKALEQIDSLLRDTLAREGLERIDAVGVAFDPTVHDAVGHMPAAPGAGPDGAPGVGEEAGAEPTAENEDEGGTGGTATPGTQVLGHAAEAADQCGPKVARVMRAGYRMKSKVLRPAMVLVGD